MPVRWSLQFSTSDAIVIITNVVFVVRNLRPKRIHQNADDGTLHFTTFNNNKHNKNNLLHHIIVIMSTAKENTHFYCRHYRPK